MTTLNINFLSQLPQRDFLIVFPFGDKFSTSHFSTLCALHWLALDRVNVAPDSWHTIVKFIAVVSPWKFASSKNATEHNVSALGSVIHDDRDHLVAFVGEKEILTATSAITIMVSVGTMTNGLLFMKRNANCDSRSARTWAFDGCCKLKNHQADRMNAENNWQKKSERSESQGRLIHQNLLVCSVTQTVSRRVYSEHDIAKEGRRG